MLEASALSESKSNKKHAKQNRYRNRVLLYDFIRVERLKIKIINNFETAPQEGYKNKLSEDCNDDVCKHAFNLPYPTHPPLGKGRREEGSIRLHFLF